MQESAPLRKQRVATLFDRVADGYDNPSQRFFPFCADRLVDYLRPAPGERLLDVACGTGALLSSGAQRVRPGGGRAAGIDLSERMLDRANNNIRKMALENVDLFPMDAEQLEFKPNHFDAIACALSLYLFPAPDAALASVLRVLRPGGRFACSLFGPTAFAPLLDPLLAHLQRYGVTEAPLWRNLTDPARCRTLLEAAGFEAITVEQESIGYHLPRPEAWWEVVTHTSLRLLVEQLAPAEQGQLRDAYLAELEGAMGEDGLWLGVDTLFCTARKPSGATS